MIEEINTLQIEIEPVFLPPKELAAKTGISVQTLANERHLGRGLPYHKHGKSILYFWPEVYSALREKKVTPRGAAK